MFSGNSKETTGCQADTSDVLSLTKDLTLFFFFWTIYRQAGHRGYIKIDRGRRAQDKEVDRHNGLVFESEKIQQIFVPQC